MNLPKLCARKAPLLCSLVLGATLFSTPALAQQDVAATPSDGIPLADRSITAQDDAASVEVNPAGLSFMRNAEFQYNLHLATADFERTVDAGHALFLAAGLGGIGVGFGAQALYSPGIGGPDVSGDYRKYTLAAALGDGNTVSVGFGLNLFGSDSSKTLDKLKTLDAGAQLRLNQYVALGLFARDLNSAFLEEDIALPVRYGMGGLLRLWDGRIQLDQELGYTQGSRFIDLTSRIVLEFVDGLRIFGRGEFSVTTDQAVAESAVLGVVAGLELSLGSFGVMGGATTQFENGAAISGQSYSVWAANNKKRSLVDINERWILLEMTGGFQDLPSGGLFGSSSQNFTELLVSLDEILADDSIEGVVLNIADPGLGWGQTWEIIDRLEALKKAGKKTVAVLQAASTRSVMIGSSADKLWMTPNIVYEPTGVFGQILNYQQAFEKLGLEAEFLRVRDYKSSPEAYVNAKPSKESLEQTGAYIDMLYKGVITTIATGRGKSEDEVKAMIDSVPLYPDEAVKQGYVDAIIYPDEVKDQLKATFGKKISLKEGFRAAPTSEERWERSPEVAILVISGAIVAGNSGASPLGDGALSGANTVIGSIERLRKDRNVKAVVLRVDSPGGSALASDQIYRELRRLAQKKPVITSMGNIAASGGYYVAAGTEEILATPMTLTGSIGIFAGKFSLGSIGGKYGINITDVPRGERSGAYSLWTPFNEEQRAFVAKYIAYLYRLFLEQVAHTRPLTADEVDLVARGHVWGGKDALDRKLVDRNGGLIQAIRRAEELAGLQPRQARYELYPRVGASLSSVQGTRAYDWVKGWITERTEALEKQNALALPLVKLIESIGTEALYPMLYEQGEALMLPPHVLVIE